MNDLTASIGGNMVAFCVLRIAEEQLDAGYGRLVLLHLRHDFCFVLLACDNQSISHLRKNRFVRTSCSYKTYAKNNSDECIYQHRIGPAIHVEFM